MLESASSLHHCLNSAFNHHFGSVITIRALPGEEVNAEPSADEKAISLEYTGSTSFTNNDSTSSEDIGSHSSVHNSSCSINNSSCSINNSSCSINRDSCSVNRDSYSQKAEASCEEKKGSPSLKQILALAPFCSEDELGSLALQYSKQIDSFHKVVSLAPFLDEDILSTIVETNLDLTINMEQFKQLLPFLDEDTVGKIARKLFLK